MKETEGFPFLKKCYLFIHERMREREREKREAETKAVGEVPWDQALSLRQMLNH